MDADFVQKRIKVMKPKTSNFTPIHEVPEIRVDQNEKRSPEEQARYLPDDLYRHLHAAWNGGYIHKIQTELKMADLQANARKKEPPEEVKKELAKLMSQNHTKVMGASAMYYSAEGTPFMLFIGSRSSDMVKRKSMVCRAIFPLFFIILIVVKIPLSQQYMEERLADTLDAKEAKAKAQEDELRKNKKRKEKRAQEQKKRAEASGKNPRKVQKMDGHMRKDRDREEEGEEEPVIKVYQDGLKPNMMARYYELVHSMCSMNHPRDDTTAKRHGVSQDGFHYSYSLEPGVDWTDDIKQSGIKPYSEDGGVMGKGPSGVMHLVDAWPQTGHEHEEILYQSSFLSGTGQSIQATRHYYEGNATLEQCIESVIRVFFPEEHALMSKVREAGRAISTEEGGGCYLGRALVFKLQLFNHVDKRDFGISTSFSAGRFTGGYLLIPQLKAKFRYRPGDLAIFNASLLYHTVTPWESLPMRPTDVVPPGRVGTVMFNPRTSVAILKDKPPGWAMKTALGRLPSSAPGYYIPEDSSESEGYESEEPF
ncbi:hypothetical protein AAF712_012058 [Marasmius tenuissimus]|uniref:Uncharacterized protein n=2 Tax=Marasmius tenuissimus TaxID=585030 RepID=A0ABR2ZIJ9_9AGAR